MDLRVSTADMWLSQFCVPNTLDLSVIFKALLDVLTLNKRPHQLTNMGGLPLEASRGGTRETISPRSMTAVSVATPAKFLGGPAEFSIQCPRNSRWKLRRQNGAADSDRIPDRVERTLSCVEETCEAEGFPDPRRLPNNLRLAARSTQHSVHPGVEHGDHLNPSVPKCGLADARDEFPESRTNAVSVLFGRCGRGRANSRNLPDRSAFNHLVVAQQKREDVSEHVRANCRQQSQGSPILTSVGVNRDQV